MDSVRHGADRHLRFGQPAPDVLPQAPGDRAVQAAHSHRLVGEPQRRIGRAQPLARIAWALAAEVHEPVERDADLIQVRVEQVPDQPGLEVVAAGRDWRVSREHDPGAGDEPRLFQGHLSRRAQLADALDRA